MFSKTCCTSHLVCTDIIHESLSCGGKNLGPVIRFPGPPIQLEDPINISPVITSFASVGDEFRRGKTCGFPLKNRKQGLTPRLPASMLFANRRVHLWCLLSESLGGLWKRLGWCSWRNRSRIIALRHAMSYRPFLR